MSASSEIISLKAVLLTALSKVEAMEKKMVAKPSKRAMDKAARLDRLMIKKRALIERNYLKRNSK